MVFLVTKEKVAMDIGVMEFVEVARFRNEKI